MLCKRNMPAYRGFLFPAGRSYLVDLLVHTIRIYQLPTCLKPYLTVTEGCHPCIRDIMSYVSNHLALGTSENQLLMVLTGPNMGGKSTIMRQTAIIIIMAQMVA